MAKIITRDPRLSRCSPPANGAATGSAANTRKMPIGNASRPWRVVSALCGSGDAASESVGGISTPFAGNSPDGRTYSTTAISR